MFKNVNFTLSRNRSLSKKYYSSYKIAKSTGMYVMRLDGGGGGGVLMGWMEYGNNFIFDVLYNT